MRVQMFARSMPEMDYGLHINMDCMGCSPRSTIERLGLPFRLPPSAEDSFRLSTGIGHLTGELGKRNG